jgi:hypothetical protein
VKAIALVFLSCVALASGGVAGCILGWIVGLWLYGPPPNDEGGLIILYPVSVGAVVGVLLGLILSVLLWQSAGREE